MTNPVHIPLGTPPLVLPRGKAPSSQPRSNPITFPSPWNTGSSNPPLLPPPPVLPPPPPAMTASSTTQRPYDPFASNQGHSRQPPSSLIASSSTNATASGSRPRMPPPEQPPLSGNPSQTYPPDHRYCTECCTMTPHSVPDMTDGAWVCELCGVVDRESRGSNLIASRADETFDQGTMGSLMYLQSQVQAGAAAGRVHKLQYGKGRMHGIGTTSAQKHLEEAGLFIHHVAGTMLKDSRLENESRMMLDNYVTLELAAKEATGKIPSRGTVYVMLGARMKSRTVNREQEDLDGKVRNRTSLTTKGKLLAAACMVVLSREIESKGEALSMEWMYQRGLIDVGKETAIRFCNRIFAFANLQGRLLVPRTGRSSNVVAHHGNNARQCPHAPNPRNPGVAFRPPSLQDRYHHGERGEQEFSPIEVAARATTKELVVHVVDAFCELYKDFATMKRGIDIEWNDSKKKMEREAEKPADEDSDDEDREEADEEDLESLATVSEALSELEGDVESDFEDDGMDGDDEPFVPEATPESEDETPTYPRQRKPATEPSIDQTTPRSPSEQQQTPQTDAPRPWTHKIMIRLHPKLSQLAPVSEQILIMFEATRPDHRDRRSTACACVLAGMEVLAETGLNRSGELLNELCHAFIEGGVSIPRVRSRLSELRMMILHFAEFLRAIDIDKTFEVAWRKDKAFKSTGLFSAARVDRCVAVLPDVLANHDALRVLALDRSKEHLKHPAIYVGKQAQPRPDVEDNGDDDVVEISPEEAGMSSDAENRSRRGQKRTVTQMVTDFEIISEGEAKRRHVEGGLRRADMPLSPDNVVTQPTSAAPQVVLTRNIPRKKIYEVPTKGSRSRSRSTRAHPSFGPFSPSPPLRPAGDDSGVEDTDRGTDAGTDDQMEATQQIEDIEALVLPASQAAAPRDGASTSVLGAGLPVGSLPTVPLPLGIALPMMSGSFAGPSVFRTLSTPTPVLAAPPPPGASWMGGLMPLPPVPVLSGATSSPAGLAFAADACTFPGKPLGAPGTSNAAFSDWNSSCPVQDSRGGRVKKAMTSRGSKAKKPIVPKPKPKKERKPPPTAEEIPRDVGLVELEKRLFNFDNTKAFAGLGYLQYPRYDVAASRLLEIDPRIVAGRRIFEVVQGWQDEKLVRVDGQTGRVPRTQEIADELEDLRAELAGSSDYGSPLFAANEIKRRLLEDQPIASIPHYLLPRSEVAARAMLGIPIDHLGDQDDDSLFEAGELESYIAAEDEVNHKLGVWGRDGTLKAHLSLVKSSQAVPKAKKSASRGRNRPRLGMGKHTPSSRIDQAALRLAIWGGGGDGSELPDLEEEENTSISLAQAVADGALMSDGGDEELADMDDKSDWEDQDEKDDDDDGAGGWTDGYEESMGGEYDDEA